MRIINILPITILTAVISLLLSSTTATADWEETYGGAGRDGGESVQHTMDGGFIIAGGTESKGEGGSDVWLIKTDCRGTVQWDRTFGGSGDDCAHSVRQTDDGGYIVVGNTTSYGAGMDDVWLIKTDSEGNRQWDRTFGETGGDVGFDVQQTSDDAYIVTGYADSYGPSPSDMWLIKTDADGNELWNRKFGGPEAESGQSILEASDGGYVIAVSGMGLIKTDSDGIMQWGPVFGGLLASVKQTSDGGYIITGRTHTYATDSIDVLLIKLDADGVEQWWRSFDGSEDGSSEDFGKSVDQTSDGGYIVAGTTTSYGMGGVDAWLIKTDPDGIMEWDRRIGGIDDEHVSQIITTIDDQYVIAGTTESYGEGGDAWLINAGVQWVKSVPGGTAHSVDQTDDGGYILTGYTWQDGSSAYDVWLAKTDANGDMQWSKSYGGEDSDRGLCVRQTSDGGYIVAGYANYVFEVDADLYLIKTDEDGDVEWRKIFSGNGYQWGYSVQQTSDGGYIVTGSTDVSGSQYPDIWLIKTTAGGVTQWGRTFGGQRSEGGYAVQQTQDDGYIIVGYTISYGAGMSDIWLIKTNTNGVIEWDRTFGGAYREYGNSVQQTTDGGYILAGETDSYGFGDHMLSFDLWLIKTDAGGNKQWDQTFGGPGDDGCYFSSDQRAQQTDDGGYLLTGHTRSFAIEGNALWLIKTDSDGKHEWDQTFRGSHHSGLQTSDGGFAVAGNSMLAKIAGPGTAYYYRDTDADGYGDSSDKQCLQSPTYPYTATVDGDCDDDDPAVYPGALEICGDGIDNDCDSVVDPGCPLTAISCLSPPNESVLDSSPTFVWTANGGADSRFAIDLSYDWTFSWYWSTYENMHQPIAAESWAMPRPLWNYIPSGSYVYWRVRGADLNVSPPTIITGDEVWWFYKQ